MSDFSNTIGLSIIGMAVIGPNIKDLDSYGFQLFQGNKFKDNSDKSLFSDNDLKAIILKTIQNAKMNFGDVGVVVYQSGLFKRIIECGFEITLKDASCQNGDFANAWVVASEWLDSEKVDAVLIIEENPDIQIFSAVLVSTSKYAASNAKQVLAVLAGISGNDLAIKNQPIGSLIQSALRSGKLDPDLIGLIVASAPLDAASEMQSPQELNMPFQSNGSLSIALTGENSGLLSSIKAVWCLYQRVIPGTSDWKSPANIQLWKNTAFYIPTESRAWFTSPNLPSRFALSINRSQKGSESAFIFREGTKNGLRKNAALQLEQHFLFPVTGESPNGLISSLEKLQNEISEKHDLQDLSNDNYKFWQKEMKPENLVACILGNNPMELNREIEFAKKGIPLALEKKMDWRTPLGSFFTPNPLGKTGSISFVYPGGFNSYPGIGRELFYLFPALYDRLANLSSNLGDLLDEKMLYPRSISVLSTADLEEAEKILSENPMAMIISGATLAALFTFLLRELFDIHPVSSFGYSLGDISMMFASGCWTQADETSTALRASPLFRIRLAGPQNAIRESWGLPLKKETDIKEIIWSSFVLMAAPDAVNEALINENRVFLTHINTPRQVVIAGDPSACARVIETLKCNSLQAPFNYALHCQPMQSEFNELQALLSWPINNQPGMTLLSAATYSAMPIEQQAIASQIAYGLCHQLDFPRLINKAYSDGVRIFIELGAGSNCARWVDESLKGNPHAAFSINRKGLDDHSAILQLLAKLISHKVPMNLSAIFS